MSVETTPTTSPTQTTTPTLTPETTTERPFIGATAIVAPSGDAAIRPFEFHASDEALADLRRRIEATRWPERETVGDGTQGVQLDLTTREVVVQGERSQLSAREFSLLHALLERPGAILSREQLENRIYGWGEEVSSNAVAVLIHGMRRKVGPDAIRNVRGLGWRVVTPAAEARSSA